MWWLVTNGAIFAQCTNTEIRRGPCRSEFSRQGGCSVESRADKTTKKKNPERLIETVKKCLSWSALLAGWGCSRRVQEAVYIWMAVDTNKCLKRFCVQLEGMSRRLKLLWGCVSSLERDWKALSKMKISSVYHFILCCYTVVLVSSFLSFLPVL